MGNMYSVEAEVRLYDKLFNCEDPKELGENWKSAFNMNSIKVIPKARIWNNYKNAKMLDVFQFERLGYFAIDYDSNIAENRLVFNRTVSLAESKEKKILNKNISI